ncbi:MAG: DUF6569 family protein [Candidatus Promineifilaceae bacterium]
MKTAANFIEAIKNETNGFSFGEPWKYDKSSTTTVLPILREIGTKRSYLVLDEAEEIQMEDTGRISSILVTNNEIDPIFIRAGNIFMGSTQERAAIFSRIVMPSKCEKIDVVCVHLSRPISGGAQVHSAGFTPRSIDLSSQRSTWDSAHAFSDSAITTLARLRSHRRRTDVAVEQRAAAKELAFAKEDDVRGNLKSFSKTIEDVLEQVPFGDSQVGIALIDDNGFAGIEVFDHSASWKPVKNQLLRREGEKITEIDVDGVVDWKPENVKKQTKNSLENHFEEEDLYKDQNTRTIKISSGNFIGEVTLIKNQVIHLHLA